MILKFQTFKKTFKRAKIQGKKVSERVDLVEAGPSEIPGLLKTIVSVVDAVPSEPPGMSKQVFESICLWNELSLQLSVPHAHNCTKISKKKN